MNTSLFCFQLVLIPTVALSTLIHNSRVLANASTLLSLLNYPQFPKPLKIAPSTGGQRATPKVHLSPSGKPAFLKEDIGRVNHGGDSTDSRDKA